MRAFAVALVSLGLAGTAGAKQPPSPPAWIAWPQVPAYAPDPAPGSGSRPITFVADDYWTSAIDAGTGKRIPGMRFHCFVNRRGRRHCELVGV